MRHFLSRKTLAFAVSPFLAALVVACGGSGGSGDTSHELGGGGGKGGAWIWVSDVKLSIPGAALHGVWAAAPDDAWAVGDAILHFDGTRWTEVPDPTSQHLGGVWGSASDDVWAVGGGIDDPGHDANLIHWDGKKWSPVSSGTKTNLSSVWGSAADDVWAVGSGGYSGVIVHYDGKKWSVAYEDQSGQPQAIHGTSASDIWVVGWAGPDIGSELLHYDGTSWTLTPTKGMTQELLNVYTFDPTHGFVVGMGEAGAYDGKTWSNVKNASVATVAGLWGSSPTDVWFAGNFRHALVTHYDGTGYQTFLKEGAALNGVGGFDKDHVWAVGENGALFRFDPKATGPATCADVAGACKSTAACGAGKGHLSDYACAAATDTCCVEASQCGGVEPSCCTPSGKPAGRPVCVGGAFACKGSQFCPLPP